MTTYRPSINQRRHQGRSRPWQKHVPREALRRSRLLKTRRSPAAPAPRRSRGPPPQQSRCRPCCLRSWLCVGEGSLVPLLARVVGSGYAGVCTRALRDATGPPNHICEPSLSSRPTSRVGPTLVPPPLAHQALPHPRRSRRLFRTPRSALRARVSPFQAPQGQAHTPPSP